MTVEIISIGTELLMGQITNTDASYLARRLRELGLTHYHQCVVGDNAARLKEALRTAFSRSDVILTSGGLGPTQDDMTKETIADVVGAPLEMHEESARRIEAFFARTGREMTPNNLRQAAFPRGAVILPNECGTAPGCIVEYRGKHLVMLPGPPFELIDMFEKQVAPWLESRSDARLDSVMLRIFGMGESTVEHTLRDLIDAQTNPTIALYAGTGEVMVRVTLRSPKNADPNGGLEPTVAEIKRRLGPVIYGEGEGGLSAVLVDVYARLGRTLAVAESLTGGMICDRIVDVPGSSRIFLEGCVAYANEAKTRALGVPPEMLAAHGAVSAPVAVQMARGIRERSVAWGGLSSTGVAGPDGGTPQKPVGLVYVGFACEGGAWVKELRLTGSRERIRQLTVLHALDMARRAALGLEMPDAVRVEA